MLKRRSGIYGDDLIAIREHGAFDTVEGKRRLYRIVTLSMAAGEGEIKWRHLPLNPVRRWRRCLDALADTLAHGTPAPARELFKRQDKLDAAERNLDGFIVEVVAKYGFTDKFDAWQSLSDEERASFFDVVSAT